MPGRLLTDHRVTLPRQHLRQIAGRWAVFCFDEKALGITATIERSIVRLDLDSQGQLVALINAIEMQIESGQPVESVVRSLGDALLALAVARGLPADRLRLAERLDTLVDPVRATSRPGTGRR